MILFLISVHLTKTRSKFLSLFIQSFRPHSISYEEDVVYDFELNISLSSPLVPSCDENSSTKVFATLRDRYFANQCFDIAIDSPNATLIGF